MLPIATQSLLALEDLIFLSFCCSDGSNGRRDRLYREFQKALGPRIRSEAKIQCFAAFD